jgi:hypothetical protein
MKADDTLTLPLDPSKPHLAALQGSIEAARIEMNVRLTVYKDAIGESEKSKEAAAQRAYEQAKAAADQEDDEDDEEAT